MDKKNINLNSLEKFLEKAKSKINEGVEDIGEINMNKLEGFLFDVKKEKENLESLKKDEIEIRKKDKESFDDMKKEFGECEFEVLYKKDLFNEMNNLSNEELFDINFKIDSNN